jgi:hypothetical protein
MGDFRQSPGMSAILLVHIVDGCQAEKMGRSVSNFRPYLILLDIFIIQGPLPAKFEP